MRKIRKSARGHYSDVRSVPDTGVCGVCDYEVVSGIVKDGNVFFASHCSKRIIRDTGDMIPVRPFWTCDEYLDKTEEKNV